MPDIEPLPADIAAAARGLWADGRRRDALALVYRGAVEAMVAMTGRALPPGATEAQCLRAAAALPDAPRRAFAHGVRLWQQAAYADRMPADDAFEAMLADAAAQFGWRR
jgi:phage tail protein X